MNDPNTDKIIQLEQNFQKLRSQFQQYWRQVEIIRNEQTKLDHDKQVLNNNSRVGLTTNTLQKIHIDTFKLEERRGFLESRINKAQEGLKTTKEDLHSLYKQCSDLCNEYVTGNPTGDYLKTTGRNGAKTEFFLPEYIVEQNEWNVQRLKVIQNSIQNDLKLLSKRLDQSYSVAKLLDIRVRKIS